MTLALVVDDSRVVRKVSRQILERLGVEVAEAEDGKLALEQCKKQRPDVILLDWNMPVMDGMEFLLAFRQMKENQGTKVIFCTTENELAKIQEALSCGADEYIMKPFDEEIIRGKLAQFQLI